MSPVWAASFWYARAVQIVMPRPAEAVSSVNQRHAPGSWPDNARHAPSRAANTNGPPTME